MNRFKRFVSAVTWIFTSKTKKIRDDRLNHEVTETVGEVAKEIKKKIL